MKSVLARAMARLAFTPPVRRALLRSRGYGLRVVLFHDIADTESTFTAGLNVTVSTQEFLSQIEFLARHYDIVSLATVLENDVVRKAGRPRLLLTFDDAYRSVAEVAAPKLRELGLPSVFFVNSQFVGNGTLALDNLLSHVINTVGLELVERAAGRPLVNPRAIWDSFLPTITTVERARFKADVANAAGIDVRLLAAAEQLYLDEPMLAGLPGTGMAIGNHTMSHVHCRTLDEQSFQDEVADNLIELERMTSQPVTSFSYPYGHRSDATSFMRGRLQQAGTEAAFLVHALPNPPRIEPLAYHRVSLHAGDGLDTFSAVEVLPRLRAVRNRMRSGGAA